MNPMFNNWLEKFKGISSEELELKSEEEKMAMWQEYCSYKEERTREYNRQRAIDRGNY